LLFVFQPTDEGVKVSASTKNRLCRCGRCQRREHNDKDERFHSHRSVTFLLLALVGHIRQLVEATSIERPASGVRIQLASGGRKPAGFTLKLVGQPAYADRSPEIISLMSDALDTKKGHCTVQ
jgi:hypothetical protein